MNSAIGLDGFYPEDGLPLLVQRRGMAEWDDGVVRILDRRELPHREVFLECQSVEEVARAIETMTIQGAFTLSLAAGYGLALSLTSAPAHEDPADVLRRAAQRLRATRPTGLALARMLDAAVVAGQDALTAGQSPVAAIVALVDAAASRLAAQALATARSALGVLEGRTRLLTHCFADRSLIYLLLEARRTGVDLELFVSETRPFLQGSRLTALSAVQVGTPVTVLTDGMGGSLMRQGRVDALVTAADLVCLDGTVCNKVGTYQFALAAHANDLPYVVLRQSGPDRECRDERDIEIEYRDPAPVLEWCGIRTAPEGVGALYPAFDVTPPSLVTSIVTDRGAFAPQRVADYFDAGPKS
jgi:methylthioribose-1-phosphate isomerase